MRHRYIAEMQGASFAECGVGQHTATTTKMATMLSKLQPQALEQAFDPACQCSRCIRLDECRATTLTEPLAREELTFFRDCYARATHQEFVNSDYLYTFDIASVVVVFELPHIYNIDEPLTLEAAKRAARQGNKDEGGGDGSAGAVG